MKKLKGNKNSKTLHYRTKVLVVCYNEKRNLGNQSGGT